MSLGFLRRCFSRAGRHCRPPGRPAMVSENGHPNEHNYWIVRISLQHPIPCGSSYFIPFRGAAHFRSLQEPLALNSPSSPTLRWGWSTPRLPSTLRGNGTPLVSATHRHLQPNPNTRAKSVRPKYRPYRPPINRQRTLPFFFAWSSGRQLGILRQRLQQLVWRSSRDDCQAAGNSISSGELYGGHQHVRYGEIQTFRK